MSGLDNLKARINYRGGRRQVDRMNEDKLRSLKRALLYSYQSATAVLSDKREFRCLINSNKLSTDLDNKIISIPFEDICLNQERVGTTTEGLQEIGMKPGDVFEWKENGTHWLVTLRYKTETAYFRAQIREAKEEVRIGDKSYWCYVRGPVEQSILWAQVQGDYYNKLNYSLLMYVTKDENTEKFFHRFNKLKIAGKPWEVQAIDNISMEGVIEVALKETFQNSIEEEHENQPEPPLLEKDLILGPKIVRPFDRVIYQVDDYYARESGQWRIESNSKSPEARIAQNEAATATVEIITSRSGNFTLVYKTDEDEIRLPIEIKPL